MAERFSLRFIPRSSMSAATTSSASRAIRSPSPFISRPIDLAPTTYFGSAAKIFSTDLTLLSKFCFLSVLGQSQHGLGRHCAFSPEQFCGARRRKGRLSSPRPYTHVRLHPHDALLVEQHVGLADESHDVVPGALCTTRINSRTFTSTASRHAVRLWDFILASVGDEHRTGIKEV